MPPTSRYYGCKHNVGTHLGASANTGMMRQFGRTKVRPYKALIQVQKQKGADYTVKEACLQCNQHPFMM